MTISHPAALIRFWLSGVRVYIGIGAVIVSLVTWRWAATAYGGQLATVRIQETFAWLSLSLVAVTLLIGPLMKVLKRVPGKPLIYDSRRAIGISAAYFGLLHTIIVYFGQLQAANPLHLPTLYRQSGLLGAIALLCLLLLAATSINRLMRRWGVWWFRVHRLIYLAILLATVHALMVGAHATDPVVLAIFGGLSLLWIGLHSYIAFAQPDKRPFRLITLSVSAIMLTAILSYGLVQQQQHNREAVAAQGHNH